MVVALRQARSRRLLVKLVGLLVFIALIWIGTGYTDAPNWGKKDVTVMETSRRVTKVSMLYGKRNFLYERALQSHKRHAERWGYAMDVLKEDISVGYWNKPSYLLSLVVAELTKPVVDRVEWLMWVDADSVIINPAIPLEIFLPPFDLDDIHMVASKDHKGLNTGIVFLRVHQWTINMLIESLGFPVYNPDVDLDVSADQTAMEIVLNKTTGGPSGKGYRDGVTYLPRTWINTYEWSHAYEGIKGNLLVHFPGLGEERWAHMSKWLDIVETTPEEWEVPLNETWYLHESAAFWDRVRTAKKAVASFEKPPQASFSSSPSSSNDRENLERAVGELKKVLHAEPYNAELLQQRIDDWNVVRGSEGGLH